mgnify:CR=1 FL=1
MKPTNDLFEQQVRGLYEGHEVPAPASTKDAVFKKLDAANSTGSLSFASKAILVAASILSIGAVYWLLNQSPTTATDNKADVKEVVESPVEVAEETPDVLEVTLSDEAEAEQLVEIEDAEQVVEIEKQVEDVAVKTTEESSAEEVIADPIDDAQEIKEIAPPVEVVDLETTIDSEAKVEEQKDEKKEEEVEWILPGKIKVEK